jgi:hypothetical protein
VLHELWVVVDRSRYAKKEAFKANRARRVLSVLESHDLPAQVLVVGNDQRFHTEYVRDCQFYQIEDDTGIFIDLG